MECKKTLSRRRRYRYSEELWRRTTEEVRSWRQEMKGERREYTLSYTLSNTLSYTLSYTLRNNDDDRRQWRRRHCRYNTRMYRMSFEEVEEQQQKYTRVLSLRFLSLWEHSQIYQSFIWSLAVVLFDSRLLWLLLFEVWWWSTLNSIAMSTVIMDIKDGRKYRHFLPLLILENKACFYGWKLL